MVVERPCVDWKSGDEEVFVVGALGKLAQKVIRGGEKVWMNTGCPARSDIWVPTFGEILHESRVEGDDRELSEEEYFDYTLKNNELPNPAKYLMMTVMSKALTRGWGEEIRRGDWIVSQDTINFFVPGFLSMSKADHVEHTLPDQLINDPSLRYVMEADSDHTHKLRLERGWAVMEKPQDHSQASLHLEYEADSWPVFVTTGAILMQVLELDVNNRITKVGKMGFGMGTTPIKYDVPMDQRDEYVSDAIEAWESGNLPGTPGVVSSMSDLKLPYLLLGDMPEGYDYKVRMRDISSFAKNGGFSARIPKEWVPVNELLGGKTVFDSAATETLLHSLNGLAKEFNSSKVSDAMTASVLERALTGGDVVSLQMALETLSKWGEIDDGIKIQLGMAMLDTYAMLNHVDRSNMFDVDIDSM